MSYTSLDIVEEYIQPNQERGIKARTRIKKDTIIGIYDGVISLFEIIEGRIKENNEHKYIVQIACEMNTLYGLVTPPSEKLHGIDFINHSCYPNVEAKNRIVLTAIRDIEAGEDLTLDYRKWDFIKEGISCWCNPSQCVI